MEFYDNLFILLAIAKIYSSKTNKKKSLEIINLSGNILKQYTKEEFRIFQPGNIIIDTELEENPGETLYEKFNFLYNLIKEKLIDNNDIRLNELNNLINTLNKSEEEELINIIIQTMTNPADIIMGS